MASVDKTLFHCSNHVRVREISTILEHRFPKCGLQSAASPGHLLEIYILWPYSRCSGFPVVQLVKNLPAMWETWVGKIPGERKSYPLQYSGLENSMDYTVHGVAKSWTRLSDFHFSLDVLTLKFCFNKSAR